MYLKCTSTTVLVYVLKNSLVQNCYIIFLIFEKKSATFSAIFAVIKVFPPFLSGNFASAVTSGDLSDKNTPLCCSHVTNFSGKVLINGSLYHCYGLFSWLYRRLCHLKRACGLKSLSRNASKSLIGPKKGYSFFSMF